MTETGEKWKYIKNKCIFYKEYLTKTNPAQAGWHQPENSLIIRGTCNNFWYSRNLTIILDLQSGTNKLDCTLVTGSLGKGHNRDKREKREQVKAI